MKKTLLAFLVIAVCFSFISRAQGSIDGIVFGDYYYLNSHHIEDIEGQHGFVIRRIYLRYRYKINDEWSTVLRFEMNHPGDFESNDTLKPYVKDAALTYSRNSSSFSLGIVGNPAFSAYEDYWGYRNVEKSPADLQKFMSSRDIGISYGYSSGGFGFRAIYGNGESNKNEINKGKSIHALLSYGQKTGLYAEGYFNHTSKDEGEKESVVSLFLAYRQKWGRLGTMYVRKDAEKDDSDTDISLFSAFGVFTLSENLDLLLRYDKVMDPNPKGNGISYLRMSGLNPSNLIIAGLAYKINKNIQFIPNIEYTFYDEENGIDTDSDLIARLTFSYKF